MQGVSPGAPPSALLWIYLLIAIIFQKKPDQTLPLLSSPVAPGVIDTVGEAGDERRRVMKRAKKKKKKGVKGNR